MIEKPGNFCDTGVFSAQVLLANLAANLRLFVDFLGFGVLLQARENVVGVGAGIIVFDNAVDGAVNGFPSWKSAF